MGPGAGGVAGDGDDVHVEGAGDAGAAPGEVAGAEEDEGPAGEVVAAVAFPAGVGLFGLEVVEAAEMAEEGHERPLGERPGVDAARGGDEDTGAVEAEAGDGGADAGGCGLDPGEAGQEGEVGRVGEAEEDVGAGEHGLPAGLLLRGAVEGGAGVVAGEAGGGEEGFVMEDLEAVGGEGAEAGDVLVFEGGCDDEDVGGRGHCGPDHARNRASIGGGAWVRWR